MGLMVKQIYADVKYGSLDMEHSPSDRWSLQVRESVSEVTVSAWCWRQLQGLRTILQSGESRLVASANHTELHRMYVRSLEYILGVIMFLDRSPLETSV